MKPRAKTIQERFGLSDPDLSTPKHDEIILWLNANIESIVAELLPEDWTEAERKSHERELNDARSVWLERLKAGTVTAQDQGHPVRLLNADIEHFRLGGNRDKENEARRRLEEHLQSIAQRWPDPGLPPPRPPCTVVARKLEVPIMDRNYAVGFIDFWAVIRKPYAYLSGVEERRAFAPRWTVATADSDLLFEVKTSIPSLGELIRQVNHYRAYRQPNQSFYVVSPDDRFRPTIEAQGIGFIKYPEAVSSAGPLFES